MNKQKVYLEFINKKGVKKNVMFYMDKQSYEMICDKSISDEDRNKYLVDEYHEYERERYYKRKFVSFDLELAESLNLISDNANLKDKFSKKIINKDVHYALSKLTPRQQEIIKLIYWEGKNQKQVGEIYGVSKQAINNSLNRIYKTLRKNLIKEN